MKLYLCMTLKGRGAILVGVLIPVELLRPVRSRTGKAENRSHVIKYKCGHIRLYMKYMWQQATLKDPVSFLRASHTIMVSYSPLGEYLRVFLDVLDTKLSEI